MATGPIRVGVREFREDLAGYLASPVPVAITRHGQTLGYYIPVRRKLDEGNLAALKRAAEELQTLMAEYGVTEEEVVSAFRARRAESQSARSRR
jgi:hypothetical protein